jgi:superfamily II DNA or RNA helicase
MAKKRNTTGNKIKSGLSVGKVKLANVPITDYAQKCDMCQFRFKGLIEYGEDIMNSQGIPVIPANYKVCYSCFAYHDVATADRLIGNMDDRQRFNWKNPLHHQISEEDDVKILESARASDETKGMLEAKVLSCMKRGVHNSLNTAINDYIEEYMNTGYVDVLKTLKMPDDLKNDAERLHMILDEGEFENRSMDAVAKTLNLTGLSEKDYQKKATHYLNVIEHFVKCEDCYFEIDGKKVVGKDLNMDEKIEVVKHRLHVDEKHPDKQCNLCGMDWANSRTKDSFFIEEPRKPTKADAEAEAKPQTKMKPKPILKITYHQAKIRLAKMNIYTRNQFNRAIKAGMLDGIDADPTQYPEWVSWNDFLPEKRKQKGITIDKIENAVKMLKKHWGFYMRQPDGFFYDWFDSWGLFEAKDPYKNLFFNSFIQLKQTPEGRTDLFDAISTGKFSMIKGHYPSGIPDQQPIPKLQKSKIKITQKQDKEKLIMIEDEELGVHKILKEAEELIPIDPNSRAFRLHMDIIVRSLWNVMFDPRREPKEYMKIKTVGLAKGRSQLKKAVVQRFLDEYKAVKDMGNTIISSDYRGKPPTMMQLYVAFMVRKKKGFCNFSRTGGGKTLSAIIASRVSKATRTVVLCPLSIVDQWEHDILEAYPLSKITKGDKNIFPIMKKSKGDYRYHVVNYDKFSHDEKADHLIKQISREPVDMVIMDEVQNVKQRYDPKRPDELHIRDEQVAKRRRNTEKLLKKLRSINPHLKVVMLTATPVINNLTEGIKLLEMVANKEFPHLKTGNKIRNASRLYTEFIEYSIRHYKKYDIKETETTIVSHTKIPNHIPDSEIRTFNYSDWEIMCTKDRIPHILKILRESNGKAIIYTEYVTKIVDALAEAVRNETNPITNKPYRVGFFTGDDKTGLKKPTEIKNHFTNPFINGDVDILIASTPVAEGIDGLQKVCNTLIFNGLPWTYAKFEQIIGRLIRTGQAEKEVTFYPILSEIEGYNYDLKIKRDRIYRKELMQMCVLDGKIPDIDGWKKKTEHTFHDFVETVILKRESRLPTNSDLRVQIRNRENQN